MQQVCYSVQASEAGRSFWNWYCITFRLLLFLSICNWQLSVSMKTTLADSLFFAKYRKSEYIPVVNHIIFTYLWAQNPQSIRQATCLRVHFTLETWNMCFGLMARRLRRSTPDAVNEWWHFYDILDNTNSNKLKKKVRGHILKSKCSSSFKDLLKSIVKEKLNSDDDAMHVVSATHNCYSLSFVPDVRKDFINPSKMCHQANGEMKNFETGFEALLTCSNAHGAGSVRVSLLWLLIPSNANVEDSQCISISAAFVKSWSENISPHSVAEVLLKVKYSKRPLWSSKSNDLSLQLSLMVERSMPATLVVQL